MATTEGQNQKRDSTRQVFQPRTKRPLRDEDLRQIDQNAIGFFRVLGEWYEAQKESSSLHRSIKRS